MIDAFHVKSPIDGITRGLNEHYDSKQDVEQDPYGAWLAIQNLWNDREDLKVENKRLREASLSVGASLMAAISLLEKGGKQAAWSDKAFDQMLADYRKSLDEFREALKKFQQVPTSGE